MSFLYLIGLLIGIAGMIVLDLRFRLFFWRSPVRAALVMVVGVAFFLAWDAAGVGLGIFFRGNLALLSGVQLAPEVPLEELFFLTLLCYLTMNVFAAVGLRAEIVADRRRIAELAVRRTDRYGRRTPVRRRVR